MLSLKKFHRSFFSTAGFALLLVFLISSCTKNDPTRAYEDDSDTWTMTIDVQDGLSGEPIKANVKYTDRKGNVVTDSTDAYGHIAINGNAPGAQSFTVSYKSAAVAGAKKAAADEYTQVVVSATGNPAVTNVLEGDLLDQTAVVSLFPLTGALSGTVKTKVNKLNAPAVVEGVVVMLTYTNPGMAGATPKAFEAVTDSVGVFSFTKLPVAAGVVLSIANKTVGTIDYSAGTFTQPVLAQNKTIPMGTIQMNPVNGNQFALITTAISIVGVSDDIVLKYTEDVDSLSQVTLENNTASGAVAITTTITGNTITVNPDVILADGQIYTLRAFVSGAKGGDLGALQLSITAQGGGLADVISSNIMDANKTAIGGFGLKDTLTFTFRDSVVSAVASVSINGTPVDVVVSKSNSTVKVSPIGSWTATTDFDLVVSATLDDQTAATLTLSNLSTAGGIALVSSNVMAPGWTGVNGLGYNEAIKITINKTVSTATASLTNNKTGNNVPVTVVSGADTIQITPSEHLSTGTSHTLAYQITSSDGQVKSSTVNFTTAASKAYVVASNVLGSDGQGLQNVPTNTTMWYQLSESVSASNLTVTVNPGTLPVIVTVSGDTISVNPVSNLASNTAYSVNIIGKTTGGEVINLDLTATAKQFTTVQAIYVVASNVMDADGNGVANFPYYGEMWVKFSENLDTDAAKIIWSNGSATNDLYGNSMNALYNSTVRISGDTLFVKPIAALTALGYGASVGFQVKVATTSGRLSGTLNFPVTYQENDLFAKWTNTIDQYGAVKDDFGLLDPVKVVSSLPFTAVTAISAGNIVANAPSDLTLDNITTSGDTIIYTPSVQLTAGTQYDIDFDITLANGIKQAGTLDISWKTGSGVAIVSTNNRAGGLFRPFAVIGDSLVVKFSKAIDTSITATQVFAVTSFVTNYTTAWSADLMTVTVKNTDTMKTADYGAPYISGSNTQAHSSVKFNLTTTDQEVKVGLIPTGEAIEIHTEVGLCILNTNLVPDHNGALELAIGETVVNEFAVDGNVTVTFNKAVDSTVIKAALSNTYFTLRKNGLAINVPHALTFSADGMTVTINPDANLEMGANYEVQVLAVPAAGRIALAGAIANHSGKASGKAGSSKILTADFTVVDVADINISALTVAIALDTNLVANVLGKRRGSSPAMKAYDAVVSAVNGLNDDGDAVTSVNAKLNFIVTESAWNANHGDSVTGYIVQVQSVTRAGVASGWYDLGSSNLGTNTFNAFAPTTGATAKRSVDLDTDEQTLLTSSLRIPDKDLAGGSYANGDDMFNDSTQIQLRVAPYIGAANKAKGEVGMWSNVLTYVDNIAPCDSDFVTGANCNSISSGGVTVSDATITWDNSGGGAANATGYISVTFPEDMDVTGPVPSVGFYYGSFALGAGTDPTIALSAVAASETASRWVSGREYRIYVSVPVFDYTNGGNSDGAYFNISVAGVKDASGIAIQSYGSRGEADAAIDTDNTNPSRTAVILDVQGSLSVINGFRACD